MNILVTINKNYLKQLTVMLYSYLKNNPYLTDVYVMNEDLTEEDFLFVKNKLKSDSLLLHDIKINNKEFANAPTSKRYPPTIYYRLIAFKYLPSNVKKVLYLDPDLIIKKDIKNIYDLNIENNCFGASTHINSLFFKTFNRLRLKTKKDSIYVNSGVLLINLEELRNSNVKLEDIYNYIKKNRVRLFLPDQDIITKLYEDKIKEFDSSIYNMTEKISPKYSDSWILENTAIIHYCGRNKPWNKFYVGKLDKYYHFYHNELFN